MQDNQHVPKTQMNPKPALPPTLNPKTGPPPPPIRVPRTSSEATTELAVNNRHAIDADIADQLIHDMSLRSALPPGDLQQIAQRSIDRLHGELTARGVSFKPATSNRDIFEMLVMEFGFERNRSVVCDV